MTLGPFVFQVLQPSNLMFCLLAYETTCVTCSSAREPGQSRGCLACCLDGFNASTAARRLTLIRSSLPDPADEVTVLATVTLADFTGQLERVLVDGNVLLPLAGFKDKESMVQAIEQHGTHRRRLRSQRHQPRSSLQPQISRPIVSFRLRRRSRVMQRHTQLKNAP